LVIKLVEYLQAQGYRPGIISRGYGGSAIRKMAKQDVMAVHADSDPAMMGDEPVLLAQRCQCPLYISASRVSAAQRLVHESDCNVIISDDGLQHYALQRDIEIVVLDGERRLGNGHCLPAGPLREGARRLRSVNFVVCNGEARNGEYAMQLQLGDACRVNDASQQKPLSSFGDARVHAAAGIGNPARFFRQLQQAGLQVVEHPFADHYAYQAQDIKFADDLPVLMTEKDAVKCRSFADDRHWFVPVMTHCDEKLLVAIAGLLKR
jgi:tetraacyldisaccharide 4'-kinase